MTQAPFIRFTRIRRARLSRYQHSLEELEGIATYPLGQDSFRISHGRDYFAFFERLGELHYHAALDRDRVVAVGAGMIRRVPLQSGDVPTRAWYLGDLKVHPDYRGQKLPLRMLSSAFWLNYLRCARGYAISMNPGDGRPNRIVKLLAHFRWAPVRFAGTLELYSMTQDEMRSCESTLKKHRGPVSYLSLQGKKEIVLTSTGAPMPLLHVQFGACAEPGLSEPQRDSHHMFCVPAGDALSLELRLQGHAPSATASLISHRMKGCDWRFVLSSDI